MGRLVRVVLYAIVVLILYFWVVSLLKSYKQNQDLKNADVEIVNDTLLQPMEDSVSINEESVYNDSNTTGEQVYEKIDETIEKLSEHGTNNKGELDKKAEVETEKPKENPSPQKEEPVVNKNANNRYMVIAGSFIKEENAKDQLKKLKNLGYNKAEIKIFISSEYHSVIVSRHSKPADAERVVQDLKKKGVESFVKEKRE